MTIRPPTWPLLNQKLWCPKWRWMVISTDNGCFSHTMAISLKNNSHFGNHYQESNITYDINHHNRWAIWHRPKFGISWESRKLVWRLCTCWILVFRMRVHLIINSFISTWKYCLTWYSHMYNEIIIFVGDNNCINAYRKMYQYITSMGKRLFKRLLLNYCIFTRWDYSILILYRRDRLKYNLYVTRVCTDKTLQSISRA